MALVIKSAPIVHDGHVPELLENAANGAASHTEEVSAASSSSSSSGGSSPSAAGITANNEAQDVSAGVPDAADHGNLEEGENAGDMPLRNNDEPLEDDGAAENESNAEEAQENSDGGNILAAAVAPAICKCITIP